MNLKMQSYIIQRYGGSHCIEGSLLVNNQESIITVRQSDSYKYTNIKQTNCRLIAHLAIQERTKRGASLWWANIQHLWSLCQNLNTFGHANMYIFFLFDVYCARAQGSTLQSKGGMLFSSSVTKDLKELNKIIYRTQNVKYRHHIKLHYKELSVLLISIFGYPNHHTKVDAVWTFRFKQWSISRSKPYGLN